MNEVRTSIPATENRIPALDGVRGMAIALVLLWHAIFMLLDTSVPVLRLIRQWTVTSRSGVDLFFVLSGFLITRILILNRSSPRFFRTFYIRRTARIFPLYYSVLALLLVGKILWPGLKVFHGSVSIQEYALFIQNYTAPFRVDDGAPIMAVTWSLAVEEQFYILFPAFVRFVPLRANLPGYVCLGVFAIASREVLLSSHGTIGGVCAYMWGVARLDSLLIGSILAWISTLWPGSFAALRRHTHRLLIPSLILLPALSPILQRDLNVRMAHWGYLLFGCIYGLLIVHSLQPAQFLHSIFTHKILRYLGQRSYSLYLIHWPILVTTYEIFQQPMKIWSASSLGISLIALGASLAVGEVSFRFFEAPIVAWGKRSTHY